MKNLVKTKEEENKEGKDGDRPVKIIKTAKVPDKKGKPKRVTTSEKEEKKKEDKKKKEEEAKKRKEEK